MEFCLLFPWIPVDTHSSTITHQISSHRYFLTNISDPNRKAHFSVIQVNTHKGSLAMSGNSPLCITYSDTAYYNRHPLQGFYVLLINQNYFALSVLLLVDRW